MGVVARFLPRTVTAQLTSLIIVSVLLGNLLTLVFLFVFFDEIVANTAPASVAVRIVTVTQIASSADSPAAADAVLVAARRSGIAVERMSLADLMPAPNAAAARAGLVEIVMRRLTNSSQVTILDDIAPSGGFRGSIVVRFDDDSALVFRPFENPVLSRLFIVFVVPLSFTLVIIVVFILLLSIYAVRWITAPLSSIAAAAESFGRYPDDDRVLSGRGPREITKVAEALNDMRARIRGLLDDRTRMLAAISHDLRTPLTRLRLRSERVMDAGLRNGMLYDITRIGHMLDETLNYLRQEGRSEDLSRVDLPSLVRTVCTEFADVGHAVSFEGPPRLARLCRPSALTRAIANVVENGIKHGSTITARLRVRDDDAVEIDVSDDGPGIPPALREQVFEPFFKADSARTASEREGFGLGLTIARDVIKDHGGEIALLERHPHGVTVRMTLPPDGERRPETSRE